MSADYDTPKDLVNRLPLLHEVDEEDIDDEDELEDASENDDDDGETSTGTATTTRGSSPNISLLTGLTSIDGVVVRNKRGRAGAMMRRRMLRQQRRMQQQQVGGSTVSSSEFSTKSGDKVSFSCLASCHSIGLILTNCLCVDSQCSVVVIVHFLRLIV